MGVNMKTNKFAENLADLCRQHADVMRAHAPPFERRSTLGGALYEARIMDWELLGEMILEAARDE